MCISLAANAGPLLEPGNWTWTIGSPCPAIVSGSGDDWDEEVIESSDCFYDDGTYYWYYHGQSSNHSYRIGVATASSPTGPWTKYSGNPILPYTGYSATAMVVKEGDTYYMWYQDAGISLATASHPIGPWTKVGVVLKDKRMGYVGGVVKVDGTWYMYGTYPNELEGDYGRCYVATASDPEGPWTVHNDPVLSPSASWEEGGYSEFEVLYYDSTFHAFYGATIYDNNRYEPVGYAWSSDGYNFTKYSENPIIDYGFDTDWNNETCGAMAEVHSIIEYPYIYVYHTLRYEGLGFSPEDLSFQIIEIDSGGTTPAPTPEPTQMPAMSVAETANPYIGHWALTIPGGGAGWLGVTQENGYLDANILWGGGSVVPMASVYMDEDTLNVTRIHKVERKDAKGDVIRTHTFTETIVAKVSGDTLQLTQIRSRSNGKGVYRSEFTGKRIPPLSPKPDLSKAKYGKPIVLFSGTNLDGWKLTNPSQTNGWSAEDGVLVNRPIQQKGKRHVSYGNLRTVAEFEDFNLKLEVNVPENSNSGVYLRGIYEVQVSDSHGKDLDSHNMGAIYSRITPRVNAEKPAGRWQTMDMTLLDRHVTVKLNDKIIIDNEPLLGCTGGALWSDEFRPGPIYLQGDHTAISYRNIVLTPIIKSQVNQ